MIESQTEFQILQNYMAPQNEIFSYFSEHNIKAVVSKMITKAFLNQSENPTLCFADYLLDYNTANMKKRTEQGVEKIQYDSEVLLK